MKKTSVTALTCLAAFTLLAGCQKDTVVPVEEAPVSEQAPVTEAPAAGAVMIRGTVLETMTTAGYTYVNVDDGAQQIWAAAPSFSVSEGDIVNVPPGQGMPEYHSKSLDKTFDIVYFVPSITVGDAAAPDPAAAMPAGHPAPDTDAADISFDGIEKAEGGITIEELFRDGADLAGKEVAIRGKVVKFSPQIMGTNWIHLQDGTSHEGANDLTLTSGAAAAKGDTVLVKGVVTLDKDFGAGYRYDLIIEDANVSVE